ncbi:transposase [Streptomyces sp. NPDC005476]|uniref:transposase n=1 Tax=Streptomyces sp. NPDC005476 TaxID=3156882 RepID=UPI00345355AD
MLAPTDLICDGRGTPSKVSTTAAKVNDLTQTLALVDGIPSVAGRPGRPRCRPDSLLGDKGYDSNPHREKLRKRRILPVISARAPRTSRAWANSATSSSRPSPCSTSSSALPSAGNAEPELHDVFVSLASALICWRRLKKHRS